VSAKGEKSRQGGKGRAASTGILSKISDSLFSK
jgi:hypothetical protein